MRFMSNVAVVNSSTVCPRLRAMVNAFRQAGVGAGGFVTEVGGGCMVVG